MTQGTVKPVNPFDPENDCNVLKKAMKGIGEIYLYVHMK